MTRCSLIAGKSIWRIMRSSFWSIQIDYLGKDFYDNILFEKFTIFKQTCALRATVFERYGGIWLDADTI